MVLWQCSAVINLFFRFKSVRLTQGGSRVTSGSGCYVMQRWRRWWV